MQQEVKDLIQKIHEGPYKLVLATAGAGTQALSDLLSIAGASNTLIESVVPYSKESFDDFVGQSPKKYVSARATRLLAGNAFYRAHKLTAKFPHFENLIGLACSASIATNRPKRGDHHAFVVTWQFNRIVQTHILFDKEQRTRLEEETVVSTIMLNMLAEACG
ncbi:MAG: cytidylyltransferase, partial [Chloroflexota bacterium]